MAIRTQRLLLQDQENCVDQFNVFGDVVELHLVSGLLRNGTRNTHVVEHHQFLRPSTLVIANGVEDSILDDSPKQLLNEECQQNAADNGKVEIVDHEKSIQGESFSSPHQLSSTEYDNIVCYQNRRSFFKCGHWRYTRNKLEIGG